MITRLKALVGYWVARRLLRFPRAVKRPELWRWMEGQFARQAALGSTAAQSFYGHILLHRGQGLGARQEGLRLLTQAALNGDSKSAYQLGVVALAGDLNQAPDFSATVKWWSAAAEGGHALAAKRLADLYSQGAEGLAADAIKAQYYREQAESLGL